jgi:hypothetical protein
LKISLREEALNRNPVWTLAPRDLRELGSDVKKALAKRLAR